ncbi:hypothetical protein TrLO_g6235 [Triparma laevis f. longispina]|uniref:Uncharacterized protein n=1 Tax=Triparma laevis f. longispina TaxID=1714387 RepID=A0A9W7KYS6_9STRA|nr:hypothetical protein TrLO_g6235 [Triparma laevis f. longispina]
MAPELESAYGNPLSFFLLACFWVFVRSSTPLISSFFKNVKKLVHASFEKLSGFVKKRGDAAATISEVEVSSTQVNPLAQMEEGASIALTEGRKTAEKEIVAAEAQVLNTVDEATGGSSQAKYKEPDKGNATYGILVQLFCTLLAFYQYWTSPNVNYLDIHLFSDHVNHECKAAYFTSVVMYKPATLSLWVVLMATSHLTYWRRVKSIPLKDQTNIDPGIPELPSNCLSAVIVWFTFFLYLLWIIVAIYFLPLLFVFLPVTLGLLYGVPISFMDFPILAVHKLCRKLKIKVDVDTNLLQMKVMAAATVVTVVCAMSFKAFYLDPGMWLEVLKKEVIALISELGEFVYILKQIFMLDFSFDISLSLGWPSNLDFPEQMPLLVSAGFLGNKYLSAGFLYVYREWEIEGWGAKWADKAGGLNRKVEKVFEAMTLGVSARVVASAKRRYNKKRLDSLEKAIARKRYGVVDESDPELVKLVDKQAKLTTGHVRLTTLTNFLVNNPDIEELDLSGSAFLEGVPEALCSMKKLKSVKFNGCENLLGTVVLPASVETLPKDAFKGCRLLEGVKMLAPLVKDIGENAFLGCESLLEKVGHQRAYSQADFIEYFRQNGMMNISSKFVLTDENIKEQVESWMDEQAVCEERCGHISTWKVSAITDMSELFKDIGTTFDDDISEWDVSSVTIMRSMFESCLLFEGGIENWDVSNVTDMREMFKGAVSFEGEGIEGWNVENVTNMWGVFDGAVKFDGRKVVSWKILEKLVFDDEHLKVAVVAWCEDSGKAEAKYGHISVWNTSEVTCMKYLFCADDDYVGETAKQFNDDISKWNVGRVENMEGMFNGAELFNQDLSGWNVEYCETMEGMFQWAKNFNRDSIINWDLEGKSTEDMFELGENGEETMEEYKEDQEELRGDLKKWEENRKFANRSLKVAAKEWCEDSGKAEAKYGHISGWDTSEVTSMKGLFRADEYGVGEAAKQFNDDISRWNVDRVETMTRMFEWARSFNQDLSGWNVEKCTDMEGMFNGAKFFDHEMIKDWTNKPDKWEKDVEELRKWKVERKFMTGTLKVAAKEWCEDSSAAEAKYGHISGWDTSEVTSMDRLFSSYAHGDGVGEAALQFNDDISGWNVDQVENMEMTFYEAESFNQDLSGWNVEKCKQFNCMFNGANKFNKDSVKNWDLKGKNTTIMFEDDEGESGDEMQQLRNNFGQQFQESETEEGDY